MITFNIKKTAIVIFTIIVLGFVFSDFIIEMDSIVNNWFGQFRTTFGLSFFNFIAFLGGIVFVTFSSIILSYFLWRMPLSGPIYLRIFWFTFLLNVGTGQLLKYLIARDRPLGAEIYEGYTYSFPSGHSLTAIFFYGFLAFIVFRFLKIELRKKYVLMISLFSLIVLIGTSRLYLGVHYLSDVLGGYLFGLFWLNMAFYFAKDIQRERKLNVVKVSS